MDHTHLRWSDEKNRQLLEERGLTFEDVAIAIKNDKVLNDGRHPDKTRFAHQRMLIVEIDGYACAVPYVIDGDRIFLKTIFKSRKERRRYAKDNGNESGS
jgi:uncharacterized DUF497 family protein